MKVIVKLNDENRVVKSKIFSYEFFETEDEFFDFISKCCLALDQPTPVILSKHLKHFVLFNLCEFTPADFVEEFIYNKMTFENIAI